MVKPEITPEVWPKKLRAGAGTRPEVEDGRHLCVLQAVNWIRNKNHEDSPECVHQFDQGILIRLNDTLPKMDPEVRSKMMYEIAVRCVDSASRGRQRFIDEILDRAMLRATGSRYTGNTKVSPFWIHDAYDESRIREVFPQRCVTYSGKTIYIRRLIDILGFYTMHQIILEAYRNED